MALQAGARLGPYEVLALIGAGGMGEVYRARDRKLARDVALKILRSPTAGDQTRLTRLTREAQVLASLNHPHIGSIYGLEEFEGQPVLVLELVEGETLADRITHGPMPLADVRPIAIQIAEALEAAHEQGIVHRDLKPANIKLGADGSIKVLDFGLAKALDPASTSSADAMNSPTYSLQGTEAGTILGTAAYMAPEQARGMRVDKRADIWAFGVLLYEMFTGERPYIGFTVADTLAAILTAEPSYERVPTSVRQLVRRCLQKDPKQRLRDIGEARITLAGPTNADATHTRPRANVSVWTIAAGVLVVTLVIALLTLQRRAAQRTDLGPLIRLNLTLNAHLPVLSPDGSRLAYIAATAADMPQPYALPRVGDSDPPTMLYTRRLSSDQSVPLSGTEGATSAFFSSNGQWLAFFAGAQLKKISVNGGAPVVLCDAPDPRGGTWGDDGTIIFASRATGSLSRVSSDGGSTQPATTLDVTRHEITHRWPQLLPGAEAVLFTAHTATGDYEDAAIELHSFRDGQRRTLVRGGYYCRYADGYFLYVRKKTLYAAAMNLGRLELTSQVVPVLENVATIETTGRALLDVSESGMLVYTGRTPLLRHTLAWLDATGGTESLQQPDEDYLQQPRISPDETRLVFAMRSTGNIELWARDFERGTSTRLTFAQGQDTDPVWAPDGHHLAISSERHGGPPNLYWMRSDGSGEIVRLTTSPNGQRPTSFSSDGTRLLYAEVNPPNARDLWVLRLDHVNSGHPVVAGSGPLIQTPFDESNGVFSPDGAWVAYESTESGPRNVYVRASGEGGGKWAISNHGGVRPVWSRKQSELFYLTGEGIMVVSYTANGGTFNAGKPRMWAKATIQDYDVVHNGRRFVVVQPETPKETSPPQLRFVLNFVSELRRRIDAVQ